MTNKQTRSLKLAALAAAIALAPLTGHTDPPWSAMEWQASCTPPGADEGSCYGYARGVADVLVLNGQACIPQDLGSVELRKVGEAYIDDHPDRDRILDENAGRLLSEAFTKQWPCRAARAE